MKKFLILLLCILLITAGFTGCKKKDVVKEKAEAYFANLPNDQNMITAQELFKKIDNKEDIFVIDVRPAEYYNDYNVGLGHIKGAVNLPFGKSIAENLKYIPNDKLVVVYSDVDSTASQVVALLIVAGINAKAVQSGFMGISNLETYSNYVDNQPVSLPTKVYQVDNDIQTAITKYFSDMSALENTPYKEFTVKPQTLKAAIDANSTEYYIVSVRKAADFAAGHIQGAVNIPFAKGMQEKFSTLPNNKKIVIYDYWAESAYQVSAILRLLGYDAYGLFGGECANGWGNLGYPLVTN